MRNAWIVAKRELYAYLASPIAYGIAAAFLVLCGLFFVGGVVQWQDANLQSLFASLSIVLLFVAPLLTMRLLAREQDQGTIELLLTAPLRDGEVIAGKFLASYFFYLGMVALTGLYVPMLAYYGTPDLGIIGAGYLGLALLGAALLALGLFTSSLTRSQVVAALLSVGAGVVLWLLEAISPILGQARADFWADGRALHPAAVIAYLSPSEHYYRFLEGVIDTRSVVYLVSFAFVFLFLAGQVLEARRWRG
jgi:ABC-2 type transport system permease protein